MTEEPIPDEFGSWARLLPSPEEKKPVVEKATEQALLAPKNVEEQPVIASAIESAAPASESAPPVIEIATPTTESTAEESATLAIASDETFADDEPLFALAAEAKASEEPVVAAEAEQEIVADEQSVIEAVAEKAEPIAAREPAAIDKAVDEIAEEKRPIEAIADKTEIKALAEPPAVEKITEHKPVEQKPTPSPEADEKIKRPFRVKLRGSLLVLVRLPNKRTIQGSFHQLSTTGGVIHFEKPLDEKLEVELIFHLKETTVRSKAQMLFPMWATQGWMQPFRFVSLVDDNRRVLDEGLKSFVGDLAKSTSAGA